MRTVLFICREGTSSLVRELFIKEDSPRKEMVRRCSIATIWFILSVVMGKGGEENKDRREHEDTIRFKRDT